MTFRGDSNRAFCLLMTSPVFLDSSSSSRRDCLPSRLQGEIQPVERTAGGKPIRVRIALDYSSRVEHSRRRASWFRTSTVGCDFSPLADRVTLRFSAARRNRRCINIGDPELISGRGNENSCAVREERAFGGAHETLQRPQLGGLAPA